MKLRKLWISLPVTAGILILAAGCAESPTAVELQPVGVDAYFSKDKATTDTTTDETTKDDEITTGAPTVGTQGVGAVAIG